ncbi:MAG: patatin-like phospholipase family protein [Kiritimatiellia bacterium]
MKTKTTNLFIARVQMILLGATLVSWAQAAPLGLVLSGGGAKGAYEVGVWQALHEAGLDKDITAVSGTSIGAVNAALFASWSDPKGAEGLWLENIGKVFVPNEKVLQVASAKKFAEFLDGRLREYADIAGIPVADLPEESRKAIRSEAEGEFKRKGILNDIAAALRAYGKVQEGRAADGLCDGDALRTVLEDNLPKSWPRATPRVYVMALETETWHAKTFCLNGGTPEARIRRLLASTAIPVVFPPVVIDGVSHVDGGWEAKGGDNVPIRPILDHHPEIKTIVVVFLQDAAHLPKAQRRRICTAAAKKGVRLVEIIPAEDIGGSLWGFQGIFDTSPETVRRLIDLGRKDTREVLEKAGLGKR